MTLLVAGNASVFDLILEADRDPENGEVGVLAANPGTQGHWHPGGAAFTIALAARREGVAVSVFHPMFADPAAAPLATHLRRAGIDLSRAPQAAGDPGRCVLVYTPDRRLAWSSPNPSLTPPDFDALLEGIEHLAITSRWEDWTDDLAKAAAGKGIPISLIGEPAPQATAFDWSTIVLNEEQLEAIGPIRSDIIVETKGAKGSVVHHGGVPTEIAAVAVTLVDTTGAGDTFGGAFLARRMLGDAPEAAAHAATKAAALACASWGAWAAIADDAASLAAPDLDKRIAGALAGTACGDAFGMPNSFLETPPWRKEMVDGPSESPYHAGYPAGRITDDTEQALALTEALEEGFGIETVATKLNDWFVSVGGEHSLAVGPSTKRAMLAYQAGRPVSDIGRTGVTNGAAMRISPIGVYAGLQNRSAEELVDLVEAACLPTHHTGVAIAGAAAVAAAIASAIRGESWDMVMSAAIDAARLGAERGAWIYSASVAERIVHARRLSREARSDQELAQIVSDVIGAGEPTTESVPAAIAIADYAGGDPALAIEIAGNLRGDTDTIAAMAGAICGAFRGIDALPPAWNAIVAETNQLDIADWSARLRQCAHQGHAAA